jgi:uncharacterized protein (TIGR03546 family)
MLNSETGTNQIAAGVAAGFILGMTPFLSLQSLLVFICFFLFRIQIGAAFISAFFFSFVAYLLDPAFHAVGSSVLEIESLQGLYTALYNMPIVPMTRFNNSVVMGSGLIALLLSPLIFLGARQLIAKYRIHVVARFKETKLFKAAQATAFYKWYYTYSRLHGE